jgi:hypothetical protein
MTEDTLTPLRIVHAQQYREQCRTWSPEGRKISPDIASALVVANRRVVEMSDDEIADMFDAQRDSFVRAMSTPCEHGELDFEQCPDCIDAAIERNAARIANQRN